MGLTAKSLPGNKFFFCVSYYKFNKSVVFNGCITVNHVTNQHCLLDRDDQRVWMAQFLRDWLFLPCDIVFTALCVSAVFAVTRCPSVCHFGVCIQTAEDIVKRLSRPDSPMILVFDPMRQYPILRGTPSVGAQNTRGGIFLRFSTEISVYLRNGTR